MAIWEKYSVNKNYQRDKKPLVRVYSRRYKDKNTYRAVFNKVATEIIKDKFSGYDKDIYLDLVVANKGTRVGVAKGKDFRCRIVKSLLEVNKKEFVEFFVDRYGNNIVFKLILTDNGVIELKLLEEDE